MAGLEPARSKRRSAPNRDDFQLSFYTPMVSAVRFELTLCLSPKQVPYQARRHTDIGCDLDGETQPNDFPLAGVIYYPSIMRYVVEHFAITI